MRIDIARHAMSDVLEPVGTGAAYDLCSSPRALYLYRVHKRYVLLLLQERRFCARSGSLSENAAAIAVRYTVAVAIE